MSHDDLRALLAEYATGELEAARAEAVRAHLASGCVACLEDVFRRPVGLQPAPNASPPPARAPRRLAAAGVVALLVLVLGGLGVLAWRGHGDAQRHEVVVRDPPPPPEPDPVLARRVARLERELIDARVAIAAQPHAAATGCDEADALHRELADAQARLDAAGRAERHRAAQLAALRTAVAERTTLADLVGTPDVRFVRLVPVPPFHAVDGHAVWSIGQDELLVYAFRLPALTAGSRYAIHVELADGEIRDLGTLAPAGDGGAVQTLTLGVAGDRLRRIAIVLEPASREVVAGSVG